MIEKGKISNRQFTILVSLYTVGTAILIIPSSLAFSAKQDSWIAGLLGLAIGLPFIWLYSKLANRFPGLNLAQIFEALLGKWIGKSVSFVFFSCFAFLLASFVLRDIGDFMTTVMLVETPIDAILLIFLAVVLYAVRLGLEVFARVTEVFIPFVVILFLVLFLSISPKIDIQNIQPIFENGAKPIFRGAISILTFPFLELFVFLMIIPYTNNPRQSQKGFILGTIIGGGILIIITLLSVMVMGVNETARSIYPSYDLTKGINIGRFFQRIEAMMALIWFITVFMKLTILTYVTALGLAHTFNLKNYKSMTFPIGILLFLLSLIIFPNSSYLIEFTPTFELYTLIFGFVLPIFLFLMAIIRKKKTESMNG
ncbi:Spore germination protein YndE [Bacillus sp. THAF10]|uniref:GerAB/ArcD/ProY family transporter n=1 Tax=Bacillus sp. THAF10 TaxID=2587848 RepID=UPI0012684C03|nr:endospore germination permease [Bacillus sp. THAF10]QFT90622.1 Spore germination protein YndE [Bacillus sp. THAF10]